MTSWLFIISFLLSLQNADQTVNHMSMKQAVKGIGQFVNSLPRERGYSLPCVDIDDGTVTIHRFFYVTRATPQGTFVSAPNYLASYDWTNRKFIALKQINLTLPESPPQPWMHSRPVFEKADDIIPEFDRIWELYDVLIPAFLENQVAGQGTIEAARKYLEYFDRHAEKPMMAYYRHFGGRFLQWVNNTAGLNRK